MVRKVLGEIAEIAGDYVWYLCGWLPIALMAMWAVSDPPAVYSIVMFTLACMSGLAMVRTRRALFELRSRSSK